MNSTVLPLYNHTFVHNELYCSPSLQITHLHIVNSTIPLLYNQTFLHNELNGSTAQQ